MSKNTFGRVLDAAGNAHFVRVDSQVGAVLSAAPWDGGTPTGATLSLAECTLLCPATPTKILALGRNYQAHAAEMGSTAPREPLLFMKPPSALIAPGKNVRLPARSARVDYEAELGIIIGAQVKNVSLPEALAAVFGYAPLCDVTARDLQREDGQWTRAKGFDTFCPVGPFITTGVDPAALSITLYQNGHLRQNGNTRDMIHNVAACVAYVSTVMTLEPGDIIATGTPEGVGPMAPGDEIRIAISELPELTFTVRAE